MFDIISGIAKGISNIASDIVSGLKDALVDPILNGLKAIFVPEDDFISNKYQQLKSEFSFVSSISSTFEGLQTMFVNPSNEAPVITLKLSGSNSNYGFDIPPQTITIDFSWYEPFKPFIDVLISALIVICFMVRQYHNLPSTINGTVGSFVEPVSGLSNYGNTSFRNNKRRGKN